MGKVARRAARWMARGAAAGGGEGAPAPPAPNVEQDVGAGVFGEPDFMDWFAGVIARSAARPRLDVSRCRANAAIEDQKASAPCECCRRLMPAAGRCADCRANGVWYCAACHDRLADLVDRRLNAAAEDQKTAAPCDGCRRVMLAADRCDDCRAMGLWFCDGCHARLDALAARHAAAAAGL